VVLGAAGMLALGALWVTLTSSHPAYDPFGWLVWGRQTLHWNLNTDGAPSWKPLPFLFTLPYAVFGRAQISLWTITASAVSLASVVFAARIAYRLARPPVAAPGRAWPALVGGVVAGLGVLGINGLAHQMVIATSDQMVVTLCLAAIDAHLSGRRRLAFALIVLASLGRPEAWLFAGLYAVWTWRAAPSARLILVVGIVLIPVGWFLIPGLTSRHWFISGDLALNSPHAIHGNQLDGVIDRFLGLYALPMKVAFAGAFALAVAWRDRGLLALAAAAGLWVAVEIAFAYHGWSATPRYMMEPAAVLVVVVGAAAGRVLGTRRGERGGWWRAGVSWAGAAGLVALAITLAPVARDHARTLQQEIKQAKVAQQRTSRLESVIAAAGGPARIKGCGQPVTTVGNQSALAWYVGLNVGEVGYKPGREIGQRRPIVFFKPYGKGWEVHPLHMPAGRANRCDRLRVASALN
jgi:hypothetical protein